MKRVVILFTLISVLWGILISAPINSKKTIHDSLHDVADFSPSLNILHICSATAVSEHTILTATHCVIDAHDTIWIIDGHIYSAATMIHDGNDHTLVRFLDEWFPTHVYIRVGRLYQTEEVFFFGNPSSYQLYDQYRRGYVSGFDPLYKYWVFDMPVIPGDSGSSIFNNRGELVGVVTATHPPFSTTHEIKFNNRQLSGRF
jgi:Trypsin-like peptidase domain